jgi:hypothetical protein
MFAPGRHRVSSGRQVGGHLLVLGIERSDGRFGDTDRLQRQPGNLVLTLVMFGELRIEVDPCPVQRRGALVVTIAERVESPAETIEVMATAPWMTCSCS